MNDKQQGGHSGGINLGDIYFVLFRHKRKIFVLGVAGILAGAIFYKLNPPPFVSEASLIVQPNTKHLPGETTKSSAVSSLGSEQHITGEMNMLFSFDSIQRVATNVGAAHILAKAGGGTDPTAAAFFIRANLQVDRPKLSPVVRVVFHHPDPLIAREVLRSILEEYQKLAKTTHQNSTGVDGVMQEKAMAAKGKVARIQDSIKVAKTNSGALFVEEDSKHIAEQISKTQGEIDNLRADITERISMYNQMAKALSTNSAATNATGTNMVAKAGDTNSTAGTGVTNKAAPVTAAVSGEPSSDTIDDYQHLKELVHELNQKREKELAVYTEESKAVRDIDAQISMWNERKKKLEAQYPRIPALALAAASTRAGRMGGTNLLARVPGSRNEAFDPVTDAAKIESLKAKLLSYEEVLRRQMASGTNISSASDTIKDLESQLKTAQEEAKSYSTYSEQLKLEEEVAAAEGFTPVIESPTPALRDKKTITRTAMMMVAGGILGGIGWAFLIELFLDRSLKRAKDVESKLGLPLFLSFPDVGRRGFVGLLTGRRGKLQLTDGAKNGGTPAANGVEIAEASVGTEIALWDHNHSLHTFYEALRDRLIGYFEVRNLTHKPKLVAVTGAGRGAGTSTIAMGLAASLSETGEGNVLLVDMNLQNGAAHQFFKGRPGCGLDEALVDSTRDTAFVQKNLYVANGSSSNAEKLPRILPKRFSSLLPKLKASDYDYIIFDMPPVSQTSITPRLAGFMDMVLMVIESEKTDREAAQRALAMLADSKANVSAVLNKTRRYVPLRLLQET